MNGSLCHRPRCCQARIGEAMLSQQANDTCPVLAATERRNDPRALSPASSLAPETVESDTIGSKPPVSDRRYSSFCRSDRTHRADTRSGASSSKLPLRCRSCPEPGSVDCRRCRLAAEHRPTRIGHRARERRPKLGHGVCLTLTHQ